jgi:BMFP domain-containing protein YqiC
MDLPCPELPALPDPRTLLLPGGVAIEHLRLAEFVQPALTPLVPLFELVDTIAALFQVVKAIPDALSMPPNPTKIAAALPGLGEKVSKLMRLVPQLSLPSTVAGLLDLVIDVLVKARSELLHLQGQLRQLEAAVDRAAQLDDPALMHILDCSKGNIEQQAANVGKSLASMGRLIGLLNMFLGMIGQPGVPDLSGLSTRPLDEVIEPLDALVETLRAARRNVPA